MARMLFVLAVVGAVVVLVAIVFAVYRLTRRDPPGFYDSKPMNPGFRSNRGRGARR
jgi:hypothetical protein